MSDSLARVTLVPITTVLAEEIALGRLGDLAQVHDFPDEGTVTICSFIVSGDFRVASAEWPWGPWLVLDGSRAAVGAAGFKGPPHDGFTEIGYGICASTRRRGLATAAVRQLIELARSNGATALVAETDTDNLASHAVLRNCAFTPDQEATPSWWTVTL